MRHLSPSRALVAATGIALAGAMLAGCTSSSSAQGGADDPDSPHPGTITWARPAASNGWEGDKCIDTSIPINAAVYDTLLRIEVPEGDGLAPGLATEWEWNEAEKAYVLTIRDDAAFSNGEPVTPEDVAFSINEWIAGDFSGSYYANIERAEAVDETTVKIVMKQTDAFLPALLTWCTSLIYPANYAGMSKEAFFQKPIGAGPYAVASWEDPMGTSERITLVPNEHYYGWDGEPPLDEVVIRTIADTNQRALEFQAGNIDLLDEIDSATATQLPEDVIVETVPTQLHALLVNMTVPGLDNPGIRQALSLALDRESLAITLEDTAVPAEGVLPINVPGWVAPTTPHTYDPERAARLIEESGVANLTFTLLYDPSDHRSDIMAQTIKQQAAAVGITVKLENTDNNTLYARMGESQFELTLTSPSAISPSIFDPIGWMAVQYGWTGSTSTTMDDEFLAGISTVDPEEQEKHVRAVQDFLTTDNGMIGLLNTGTKYASQPWVKGFEPLLYRTFYFDTLAD
ncbi:ABC transporter substrate-binding protein [Microbacterium sp.]|uniref:ABC transporter substrate-binding protein n=1 Tax=Microbacterium sp. TaxID=51671 RepID=UPI002810FCB3|nr:ABC transporter substrate-binding protein [Microbacterium sp.]